MTQPSQEYPTTRFYLIPAALLGLLVLIALLFLVVRPTPGARFASLRGLPLVSNTERNPGSLAAPNGIAPEPGLTCTVACAGTFNMPDLDALLAAQSAGLGVVDQEVIDGLLGDADPDEGDPRAEVGDAPAWWGDAPETATDANFVEEAVGGASDQAAMAAEPMPVVSSPVVVAPRPPAPTFPVVTIRSPAGFTATHLRTAPGADAPAVRLLPNGTRVELLGQMVMADGFRWRRVRTMDGAVGWAVAVAAGG